MMPAAEYHTRQSLEDCAKLDSNLQIDFHGVDVIASEWEPCP